MNQVAIIGLVAGLLSTGAFIPQIIKVALTKDTKSISLVMYIIYLCGILLWLIYGALMDEVVLLITNSFSFLLGSIMLGLKLKYK